MAETLTTKNLSLKDAILLALRYNPSVKSAEIQRVVDKFNLRLAENALELQYALTGSTNYTNTRSSGFTSYSTSSNLTPQVNLTTPIGTNFSLTMPNNVTSSKGVKATYNPALTLTMTQPLLQGAGTEVSPASVGLYTARIQEEVNKLSLKNSVIQVVSQVISQYMQLVQAENTIDMQKASLVKAKATVKQYEILIKTGRNPPTDIVQTQADVASQEVNLQQSLINLQQAQQSLLYTLGLDSSMNITVPTTIRFDDEHVPDLKKSTELALKNNVSYQQQLWNLKVTERQLIVARDQQRWQLNLQTSSTTGGGSGGGDNASLESLTNGQNTNNQVGLQLTVPLDNYQVKANLVRAKVALDQAKINLAGTRRQIETQVVAAVVN